jgi:hypothetical protein
VAKSCVEAAWCTQAEGIVVVRGASAKRHAAPRLRAQLWSGVLPASSRNAKSTPCDSVNFS